MTAACAPARLDRGEALRQVDDKAVQKGAVARGEPGARAEERRVDAGECLGMLGPSTRWLASSAQRYNIGLPVPALELVSDLWLS